MAKTKKQRKQSIRVVSRTVENGQVSFNQVVMDNNPSPAGIYLVALEPDAGVHVWLRPHDLVAKKAKTQIDGYSQLLPSFPLDKPPSVLGPAVFLPLDSFDPVRWEEIKTAKTNRLNRIFRDIFGFRGG